MIKNLKRLKKWKWPVLYVFACFVKGYIYQRRRRNLAVFTHCLQLWRVLVKMHFVLSYKKIITSSIFILFMFEICVRYSPRILVVIWNIEPWVNYFPPIRFEDHVIAWIFIFLRKLKTHCYTLLVEIDFLD